MVTVGSIIYKNQTCSFFLSRNSNSNQTIGLLDYTMASIYLPILLDDSFNNTCYNGKTNKIATRKAKCYLQTYGYLDMCLYISNKFVSQ